MAVIYRGPREKSTFARGKPVDTLQGIATV